ncbi:hypothetical protein FE257_007350 [Aspergillus nanangensis]|uniref:Major facilitator superfamily (MFS) profile domain-containing protein n=1 Tax=Aspergillus nanangensis TaxID=2582783 RepID=A0AAD4CNF3_ASPNN|nr:hypothetical protein FE257_007350 [Aspergillus nanangensis]
MATFAAMSSSLSDSQDITELRKLPTGRDFSMSQPPLENASKTKSTMHQHPEDPINRIPVVPSHHRERNSSVHSPSQTPCSTEEEPPQQQQHQGIPPELGSLTAEVIFVVVCSAPLLLFSFLLGDITVTHEQFKRTLGMQNSALPWLLGAYTTPLSLSVVISGSLSDLTSPRTLILAAFAWLTLWNVVGAFAIHADCAVLFYLVRAMQGLSIGVLVSASMSILGRVYKPGLRKNQVFSAMAATSPFGFWLGAIQGGAP